ncbi:hypothetical protein MPH_00042 [Macrophomina phaseolina MS6]|uniref:Uncharacterized protein n=1 Tax=Macrophomina phaseolina (strain MS6) TaxID=1126212 RepID=K2SJK3_MACPH|nr:hypothetical protein MPH_00042 [Macrophomina phaseolina MS6]
MRRKEAALNPQLAMRHSASGLKVSRQAALQGRMLPRKPNIRAKWKETRRVVASRTCPRPSPKSMLGRSGSHGRPTLHQPLIPILVTLLSANASWHTTYFTGCTTTPSKPSSKMQTRPRRSPSY